MLILNAPYPTPCIILWAPIMYILSLMHGGLGVSESSRAKLHFTDVN